MCTFRIEHVDAVVVTWRTYGTALDATLLDVLDTMAVYERTTRRRFLTAPVIDTIQRGRERAQAAVKVNLAGTFDLMRMQGNPDRRWGWQ